MDFEFLDLLEEEKEKKIDDFEFFEPTQFGMDTQATTESAEFTSPMDKINFYKIQIDKLEGIAKEKGGLGGSGYDAYRYAIEQYNKAIKEHNVNLPLIEGLPKSLPSDKPKPEVPSGWGISDVTTPEKLSGVEKGIIGVFGTWEAKKRAMPELQKMEDFAMKIAEEGGKTPHERVAYIQELLTGQPQEQTLKEIRSQKDLNVFFANPPEKYKEAVNLERQSIDILQRVAEPGKDFIGQVGWAGMAIVMGTQAVNALYKGGMVVENKIIKGEKLKQAVGRIQKAYIDKTGKFKSSLSNNDFRIAQSLNQTLKRHGKEIFPLQSMEVPQEVFLGQAGKITNLVKVIQNAGKLTPKVTSQLKTLSSIEVSQVTQALMNTSPALANEFLKAVEISKKPKLEETVSGLAKPDEILLKKINQGQPYDLKGVNLSTVSNILKRNKDKIINAKVKSLKADIEGKEVGLFGAKKTAKWIEDFKVAFGKEPTEAQLKEIAVEQLTKGYEELGGKVEPDDKFIKIDTALKEIEETKKPEDKTLDMFAKVEPTTEQKAEVGEAPAPVKEDFEALDTTDKNKELFYEKYNNVYAETKKAYDKLIDERVAELKEEGFKGVDKGGVRKDEEGYVIGKYGATSRNPKWYREFYEQNKKKPSNKDLEEIAKEQLSKGHIEDYGEIPANQIFNKLEAQVESYETILSDIKTGDYSFEEPKNVTKLNDKLKELEKTNKQIKAESLKEKEKLTGELETLKEEKAGKFKELYKEVEVKEKVEIQAGVKKGVKEAITGKKLKGLSQEEYKQGNQIIGQIHKAVNEKGLTKTEFSDIKMGYGYTRSLSGKAKRMTIPQLEAVLKAVERARPKRIGWKTVITPKTEKKIQSLKDNLIDKLQMTEEAYADTLKSVGVYKEPKYTDAQNFITEKQGKDIIYRLIDEANILKITMPLDRAVTENKPIKTEVDKIAGRIQATGGQKVKDPHELASMRLYIQKMEAITGEPFYPLYQDLINSHLENKQKLGEFIKGFEPYKEILKDDKELKKVNDYILAKSSLKDRPPVPDNITEKEIKLAKKIEKILADYEAKARTEKFLDNIDHPENIPQYLEFKKDIDKAKDIYESKGYDDLIEYMKTQKWGVIRSGYSPLQVLTPKIRIYKPKAQTFGKTHIKVRTDMEYHEQDRNIIQRLFSYKKQMDNLVVMRPKVRALITQIDKNLSKFKDPAKISRNMEAFFRELKGYNRPENWFDRGLNRLYAQAMQTIIMPSPVLSGRNLLQNIAFGHDKSLLINPLNKKLTPDEIDYFNTYISQVEAMKADWLMVGEKPLPGLGGLTKIVRKIGIYPYSDLANRHWGYWAKINQVKRAFAGDKSLDKKMKGAKFSDMEAVEQKQALQILAQDGEEAMARYVARVYVDNTQFLYDRSQRSPAEMGRVGRWAGNLMLFPRAYWEMLYKQGRKMGGKYVPVRERVRAFRVIASVIGGGILIGAAYKKVTGRKENPYDPIVLLAYEPGGLAIGTVEAVTDVYINLLMASKGDDRAMAALTTAIPKAADMFIPFYAYTTRALEASTDTKNIDRLALRKIRMMIDKEYKVRGGTYILEREAMEKWQYFLSGAGIDVEIKEKEAEAKKAPIDLDKLGEDFEFSEAFEFTDFTEDFEFSEDIVL